MGWDKHYPSEEHLIKLKMPVENIHLEAFYDDGKFYSIINRLYLLLRNYNTEIDIALLHFPQSGLNTAVKKRDLDTLLFKPGFLTENIMEVLKEFNYKELPAHNTIAHEIQHTSEQNRARKQGEQWPMPTHRSIWRKQRSLPLFSKDLQTAATFQILSRPCSIRMSL